MEIWYTEKELKTPFHIFPKEIWEVVIEQLEDSEDILSTLLAFSHLKVTFPENQSSWLVGAVMPLLFPKFLNRQDIVSCRLVSKRWRNAVGKSLEQHPDRLPYKSVIPTRMTSTHFNYQSLPRYAFTSDLIQLKDDLGNGIICEDNPFPGKKIHMVLKGRSTNHGVQLQWSNTDHIYVDEHMELSQVFPVLQQYGHHIWYISFNVVVVDVYSIRWVISEVLIPMIKFLTFLPNLKLLKITEVGFPSCDISESVGREFRDLLNGTTFPFRLETLYLWENYNCDYPDENHLHYSFIMPLVNHVNVKRLALHLPYWKREYSNLFPNLSDLCVRAVNKIGLQNILQDLSSSPIKKLTIHTIQLFASEIMEILPLYQIEFLELHGEIRVKHCLTPVVISRLRKQFSSLSRRQFAKGSIKAASIEIINLQLMRIPSMGLDFLYYMPSLRHISIDLTLTVRSWMDPGTYYARKSIHNYGKDDFLTYILDFYDDDKHDHENFQFVWKVWPNLLVLTMHKYGKVYQYARECQDKVFISCNGSA